MYYNYLRIRTQQRPTTTATTSTTTTTTTETTSTTTTTTPFTTHPDSLLKIEVMTEHALVGLESYEEYEEGESGDYYDDYESEEYGEIEEEGENDSGPTDSNIPRLFDWQQVIAPGGYIHTLPLLCNTRCGARGIDLPGSGRGRWRVSGSCPGPPPSSR